MEDFILGLLMINKLTAYELHTVIKNSYEGICSHSIGNIQRALKKLHEKGHVSLNEVHEGKVVKKIFSITPVGRERFMIWLNNPLDLLKAKNMEVGKLLLMGFLTPEQQLANIDKTIADYREAYGYMKAVEDEATMAHERMVNAKGGLEQHFIKHMEAGYMKEMLDSVETNDYSEVANNVIKFGWFTLRFAVAQMKFELEWFENLREELVAEMNEKVNE